jgi:hypothetical protein
MCTRQGPEAKVLGGRGSAGRSQGAGKIASGAARPLKPPLLRKLRRRRGGARGVVGVGAASSLLGKRPAARGARARRRAAGWGGGDGGWRGARGGDVGGRVSPRGGVQCVAGCGPPGYSPGLSDAGKAQGHAP